MADGKPDGGTEQMMGWAMIFVMFLICMYVVYYLWTDEIHSLVRWIRYGEIWLISVFTSDSYTVTLANGDQINLNDWLEGIKNIPADRITPKLLGIMTEIAMAPVRWIIVGIIGLMALWAYTKGPGTQYVEIFNLDRFIKHQAKAFKIISPFVKFNPSNQPPRAPGSPVPAELPLFAEALGPEEWLAYNQIPVPDGVLDQRELFKEFAKQLGPRWRGTKNLKPHQQILMAAFCLKAARKRADSDEMLGRIASCWSHENGLSLNQDAGLLRQARKILKNKDISYPLLKACNQHAWTTTAMLRALLFARENGGVLSPSQFVWLRGFDRELWYPLNNLGRQSSHMEAIGAMAHFRVEKRAQRPIPRAKVQDAVQSITEYMASLDARPIPTVDYSKSSNKRGIKKLKTT